jgi:putative ATPase
MSRGSESAGASVILWGPPGSGKTTLARLIAKSRQAEFVELAAFAAGVAQVREVLSAAKDRQTLFDRETVLFIDEFHRFSSAQQDSLLGAVEAGSILLIAATTENPSVAVTRPLLSRSRVFELRTHDAASLSSILDRAVSSDAALQGKSISGEAKESLIAISGGDARIALGLLEAAASHSAAEINKQDVELANQTVPNYDRAGIQHYSVISAFIKSVRGSDPDAALQYLAMMIVGGEDPMFIARRLVILAAEDIGLADPGALQVATSAATATSLIGLPEARIPLAEATIYLCLSPKSNSAYLAINAAIEQVSKAWPVVPEWLINHSPEYLYPHDSDLGILEQDYGSVQTFYVPKRFGLEAGYADRLAAIKRILRGDDSR